MRDSPKGTHGPTGTAGLGTFSGVFTPSVLTILGIILFLRLGYVVGSAGMARALIILVMANAISILTSVSLSAIATNLKVKGGGDYYLISRTLGVEFGGAIGIVLFLAQAVSIAFYCIGFGEAMAAMGPLTAVGISPRLIAAIAVGFLFILSWLGADWATKFQFVVMGLLAAALISFFAGGIPRWDLVVFKANWSAPSSGGSFWILFALFFPAVTGFTQGVSMSGDLKDAGKSIPLGTFLAVGVSVVVYFGAAVLFGGVLPNESLSADYLAMKRTAKLGFLIDAGVIAATLSSAMASFLGAPRILQSLSGDRIFPFLNIFAKGSGPANNPRRGVLLSAGIAFTTVALGNLNLIAPIVSMFFLISYGLLNYATFYESRAASPSFRPTFKWFEGRLSLLGALACLGVMLAIDPATGITAAAILFAIYQYLRRTAGPTRWADSRRGYYLQRARENLLAAGTTPEHPRDWRPQILAFSQDRGRRPPLLHMASWLEGGSGMTTVVTLFQGRDLALRKSREEAEKDLRQDLQDHHPHAFPLVITTPHLETALHTLLQSHGVGPLHVNTVLMNWLNPHTMTSQGFREFLFGRHLKTLHRQGCNILVLYAEDSKWDKLMATQPEACRIDVWWSDDATSRLMLLFAYLMTRSEAYKKAEVHLYALCPIGGEQEQVTALAAELEEARIAAEVHIITENTASAVVEASAGSTLVFLPFHLNGNLIETLVPGRVEVLLEDLPTTVLTLAAEDIDLDAEPEEGAAAELAEAMDDLNEMKKKAEDKEKESTRAQKVAEEARHKYENALADRTARLGSQQDPEGLSDTFPDEAVDHLQKEATRAAEAAEEATRRAAKAQAKVQEAEKEMKQ